MKLISGVLFLSLVLCFCIFVVAELDYYKILGVAQDADEREIKKLYRTLSKKYHPDKNPGDDEAHESFIRIGELYEVLSDLEKRSIYDRYGEDAVKNGGHQQQQQQHHQFNPFEQFFGNQFGQQLRHGHQGKPRGQNIQTSMEFTLKEFYNGVTKDFQVRLQDICDICKGTGSKDGKTHTCQLCQGHGMKIIKQQILPGMFQQFQTTCDKCDGKGKIISHKCSKCHGNGVFENKRSNSITVQPGMPRDHVEVLEGELDHSPDWELGDLLVRFKEEPRDNLGYVRVGDNLYRTEVLSLKELLYGDWQRLIPFLDEYDPQILLQRLKGQVVQNGQIEVVKGKGMPKFGELHDGSEFGDLFIEWLVILPQKWNSKDEL